MNFKKIISGVILSLILSVPCTAATEAEDSVVSDESSLIYSDDFELETINGWSVLGGVGTMSIDTSRKQSGSSSLNITGRANSFNGPSISLNRIMEAEETYRFEGWLYHESTKTETFNCTLKFSDSVNVDSYTGVAVIEAPPSTWVHFEGSVDTPEDLYTTLLYFESPDSTVDFNIDNIKIYGKTPEGAESAKRKNNKSGNSVSSYKFDFESGFGEWISRGDDTRIIRTNEQSCTGEYSILSTNRQKSWNGPTVLIDGVERGKEYTYEANVLYTEKKADDSHLFMLQVQYSYNGNEVYELIESAEVTKNTWTKISGTHVIPEGASNVMLYVQTDNVEDDATLTFTDLVSFYIDDVSAIRSDLVNPKKNIVLVLILAGIIAALVILVVIIVKSLSQSSDETNEEEKEELDSVSKVINSIENNKPVLTADSGTKTPDNTAETKNESKSAGSKDSSSENKEKVSVTEKSNTTEKSAEKPEKSESPVSDDSRARDIFNIETFSYDEGNKQYDENSDDPLENPFEGF